MIGKRWLVWFSLIYIFIIVASAYLPWDFCGVYKDITIADAHLYDGQTVTVIGRIYHKEIKNEQPIYYVNCSSVTFDGGTLKNISLILNLNSDNFPNNSTICATGVVDTFDVARNDGNFNTKAYYNSLGLTCRVAGENAEVLKCSKLISNDLFYKINKAILALYNQVLPGEEAGFLASVTIGNKSELQGELKELFNQVGVAHVLAVSGLHVGFVCMGLYGLLRKKGISFVNSGIAAGVVAVLYCVFTGGSVSGIRAVGMFLIYIIAQILGEVYDMLTAVFVMADLLLISNPLYIINSSFIFSFSAVLIIVFVARPLAEGYKCYCKSYMEKKIPILGQQAGFEKSTGRKLIEKLTGGFIFSFAITVGMLPITTIFFYQTPMYSIFLNLFILPIMPVLLGLGLIGGFCGLVIYPVGYFLLKICHFIIFFYEFMADLCNRLPGGLRITGYHGVIIIFIYYGLIWGFLWIFQHKKLIIQIVALGMLSLIILIPQKEKFEVDILDVGQGDGIYISSGDDVSFFIDGGSTSESELVKYRLLPFLKYKGKSYIDFWFLSHMDLDHVSGVLELLGDGYEIRNIVLSSQIPQGDTLDKLLSLCRLNGTNVIYMNTGDVLGTKHLKFTCVFPGNDYMSDDVNDLSLSLLMEYDRDVDGEIDYSGFFGGDIAMEQELLIAQSGSVGHVDLLKVSHHGSRFSSDSMFLETLSPDIAVVSCAKKNRYGHPADEAVKRLNEGTGRVYYTMNSGRIRLTENTVEEFIPNSN